MQLHSTSFLGMDFTCGFKGSWIDLLLHSSAEVPYSYLATPNVDHLVRFLDGSILQDAYTSAAYRVCDSRILEKLAAIRGKRLLAYPGSDLVLDFLNHPQSEGKKISIIGPDEESIKALRDKFPRHNLRLIASSKSLLRGSEEWNRCLYDCMAEPFDVLMICISFPKQEYFAYDLLNSNCKSGLAICVGASIDFITGQQKRAPHFFQVTSFEWLYRLLSNPVRFWSRYLGADLKIFYYFFKYK